ncbi:YpfB family protein [Fervidibacillus halotolerans]|uniref:YpfB family protein n=1 Tax=Fervidibacillus halotolerans TaxID=2980027 RepID=A0A9E8M225_9BACI|nr:YpfB family protein [Fervidibacillus halotolerans]WAA13776.1 YpfB family protein [Fervidibacillus halotolerans]
MKRMEGILKKVIVIQFIFLLLTQIFLHHFHFLPELNHIVLYEGVNRNNHEKVVQTLNQP